MASKVFYWWVLVGCGLGFTVRCLDTVCAVEPCVRILNYFHKNVSSIVYDESNDSVHWEPVCKYSLGPSLSTEKLV